MPRKARIDYPGLTHHIMARTFFDLLLFNDDEDKDFYLSCLSRRLKECGCICYAWVLMDNHVHLLIRTGEKPLWQLMKPLHSDYSRWYNKKYNRRGPLFVDRYKSIATQDQNYLEQLVRYIHLNPVRAGVCKTLLQLRKFPWAGHGAVMGIHTNDFQDVKSVLRRFGRSIVDGREKYEDYLKEGLKSGIADDVISNIRKSNKGQKDKNHSECWVIGDHDFQKSIISRDAENRITLAKYKKEGFDLESLAKRVSSKMGVDVSLMRKTSKRTRLADSRKVLCAIGSSLGFSTREIGAFLGIQQAAVSHASRKGGVILENENLKIV